MSVSQLKSFARIDDDQPHSLNLHECLDSTLLILNNRLKQVKLAKDYDELPAIEGYAGALYQVFMNIISNALDALQEQVEPAPEIAIATFLLPSGSVCVRIADNGPGMNAATQQEMFNPFFTTKPPGIGTGLGLAISRQIVEEKHGGKIICRSAPGRGTEFAIALPARAGAEVAAAPEFAAQSAG